MHFYSVLNALIMDGVFFHNETALPFITADVKYVDVLY